MKKIDIKTVRRLPKVELHCHLDGSLPIKTIQKLAKLQHYPLPTAEKALKKLFVAPKECDDLAEYLTRFNIVLELLQTSEALELAAYDLIASVAEENVCYIEVRFAPLLSTNKGLSVSEVVDAVLKGINRGQADFSVKANLLLCGMRHMKVAESLVVIESAKENQGSGVVGVDVAGDEKAFPPYVMKEFADLANQYGILLTMHAGECGCAQNVAESVELGAKRIGHGVAMVKDPAIMKLCADKEILMEMCPTSNLQTKAIKNWEDYPLQTFLDNQVKVTISTDNRTVSQTTLTNEYMQLAEHFDVSYEQLYQFNKNGIYYSFADMLTKEKIMAQLESEYKSVLN